MNSKHEIQIIWEYIVKNEYLKDFIRVYSSSGEWAKLFSRCPGYIKTELKRDTVDRQKFITIDFWESRSSFSVMKQVIGLEYDLIDKKCKTYTLSEKKIGVFRNIKEFER